LIWGVVELALVAGYLFHLVFQCGAVFDFDILRVHVIRPRMESGRHLWSTRSIALSVSIAAIRDAM